MRWFFHIVAADKIGWGSDGRYRAPSLASEGFIHASFRDDVIASARMHFAGVAGDDLRVLAIDPRRLDVPVEIAATPRGPMPHIRGGIPVDAVRVLRFDAVADHPDRVTGTRIALCAFGGMTLLDLVGPLDVLSRLASMDFDATSSCEIIALTRPPEDETVMDVLVWTGSGASLVARHYRPDLDHFDVLVVAGGPATRELERDPALGAYLASYPHNRLVASVCTGALLLGAAGRLEGRRATTHASAFERLRNFGATVVTDQRVVDDGNLLTSGGVTAGIDLGLRLVARLEGAAVAQAIAERINFPAGFAFDLDGSPMLRERA